MQKRGSLPEGTAANGVSASLQKAEKCVQSKNTVKEETHVQDFTCRQTGSKHLQNGH